jgi:hypothetical protein
MYPTSTAWHTIVVEVPEVAAPGSLSLMFTNLRDYEHGCTAPEVRAGDTTCGPGPDQGELSEQLAVHLGGGWTSASDDPAACTDLVDVATGDVWLRDVEDTALGTELPTIDDGDTACVVLGLEFADRDDNNLAMGDETVFDLEVGLQGPAGDQTAVLGVALDAPGADRGEPGRPQLATTGAALSLLLAAALTALVVGGYLALVTAIGVLWPGEGRLPARAAAAARARRMWRSNRNCWPMTRNAPSTSCSWTSAATTSAASAPTAA